MWSAQACLRCGSKLPHSKRRLSTQPGNSFAGIPDALSIPAFTGMTSKGHAVGAGREQCGTLHIARGSWSHGRPGGSPVHRAHGILARTL